MKLMTNKVQTNTVDRIFTIIRILLALSPFMALTYLSVDTAKYGGSLQSILQSNPKFTVMFLVAMINPFIAYLLGYLKEHLDDGDYGYAMINLGLMIIAELMLQNLIYVLVLAFLIYQCIKTYKISVKDSVQKTFKNHFLRDISGSIVVLIFAAICLFAMIQIGQVGI